MDSDSARTASSRSQARKLWYIRVWPESLFGRVEVTPVHGPRRLAEKRMRELLRRKSRPAMKQTLSDPKDQYKRYVWDGFGKWFGKVARTP